MKDRRKKKTLKPLEVGLQTFSLLGHRLRTTIVEERKK